MAIFNESWRAGAALYLAGPLRLLGVSIAAFSTLKLLQQLGVLP